MLGVDLNTFVFDYDLTFSVLLMNADGTIYHRYGARDASSGTSHMSMDGLVRLMKDSIADHQDYQRSPKAIEARAKRTVEQIPPMARRIEKRQREGKKHNAEEDCIHCHMVNDTEREWAQEEKRWSREKTLGSWPLPTKVGLELDREDQALVRAVLAGSAAAKAGLRAGDRITRLGEVRIRTVSDASWALHQAGSGPTSLAIEFRRGEDAGRHASLELSGGWKAPTDLEFSWRSSMWSLKPQPGFGGRKLSEGELKERGLPPGSFAMRVGYIVDWGNESHLGANVKKAGLRKEDIVLAVAGKRDFSSELHFQSWFRFNRKAGEEIEIEILREGKRQTLKLKVLE
jgi:C-terminal processing protease CtpA/Prc